MKSLFKRALASATGSVLVLSQIAATAAVNTGAAADPIVLDKEWVLDVPVDITNLVADGSVVSTRLPVVAGESDWNVDFEDAVLATAGDKEVVKTISVNRVKNAIQNNVGLIPFLTDEDVQKIVAAVDNEAVAKIADEQTVITISSDEIGNVIADKVLALMDRQGVALADDNGNELVVDWSGFSAKYDVTVTVDYDYSKSVSYKAVITAEDGKTYALNDIDQYIIKKYSEAINTIKKAVLTATEGYVSFEDLGGDLTALDEKMDNYLAKAEEKAKAVYAITESGNSFQGVYDAYVADVTKAVGEKAGAKLEKYLAKAQAAFAGKADNAIDKAIASVANLAAPSVVVDMTADDLKAIVDGAQSVSIDVPNGISAIMTITVEDDQNAELVAALQEVDETLVSIESYKEITLSVENELDGSGVLSFDVVRYAYSPKFDEQVSSSTTTTTTTIITTTTSEESSTTTTTTTAAVYEVNVRAENMPEDGLVYWSEEETAFDLANVKVFMTVIKNGAPVADVDVSAAFAPNATKPTELEFVGFGKYSLNVSLTDADAVAAALTDAGLDAEAVLAAASLTDGYIPENGDVNVVLVLRGDADLNNVVDSIDAMTILQYYADIVVTQIDPSKSTGVKNMLKNQDGLITLLPYAHYAADAYDGNGNVLLQDAQLTLRWYAENVVIQRETSWDELRGTAVVPQPELHARPLAYDTAAAAAVAKG